MFAEILLLQISAFLLVSWTVLYLYFTRKFDHWKKKNVPFVPPVPFFGNVFNVLILKQSIGGFTRAIYEGTKAPFVGFFVCDEPCLLIRDLELAKSILIRDFDVFSNRSVFNDRKVDPVGSNMLFLIKTPDWRGVRRKITPVFTTGKLKNMFQLLDDASENMIDFFKKEIDAHSPIIDIRDSSAKFTTDAITSAAFGIEANCFKYENSEFRNVSRRVFNLNLLERAVAMSAYFMTPTLVKLFKLKFIDKTSTDFLTNVFWKTMDEREELKFVRNDLLDILIEMKKKGEISNLSKKESDKIVAQAVQFFVAGFETTSSTISFALYEIAHNKDVQRRLRSDIKDTIKKHGGLSYDSLKDMKYLDMCLKETLRKYPVLPFLDRRCEKDYHIPGTDVVLEKGSAIFIPVWGLQHDPEYFPNPEKFHPERFSEDSNSFAYLPFGEGPRNCIGVRFGVVTAKLGVAKIINEFAIELSEKTKYPLEFGTKGMLLAPVSNILLKFKKCDF